MAKSKASLGQHARLTRRAKHLITLLRKTRVHSVRQAILRELAHEFDRIRRGARAAGRTARRGGHAARRTARRSRLYARLEAWALDKAHGLGNRIRHGATFVGHDGREIRGGNLGQKAYTARHDREADRPPHERDGKRDERTPRQKARDHARDHLAAAGRIGPDGNLTRDPLQGHLHPRDLRDRARGDADGTARDSTTQWRDNPSPRPPEPPADRAAAARESAGDYAGAGPQPPLREAEPYDSPEPLERDPRASNAREQPAPRARDRRIGLLDERFDPCGAPPLPADRTTPGPGRPPRSR
jgi:hypothetical protein